MTIDLDRLRNEFLNTQVITRNTGKRLGVVREVLVDIDRREIVVLGLRDNRLSLSGIPKYMYLDRVIQTGDVVLVENEDVIEDVDIEIYNPLINCEVVTETGEPLGKVRDFQFNLQTGKLETLIIATLGYPQIPEQLISTYELSVEEIVSSGPDRIIVFEGAEQRISQISVGVLEKLGIGRPPWEKEDEEMYYAPTTPPENQLPTGIPVAPPPVRKPIETTSVIENNWSEDEYEEVPVSPPRRQKESIRYEEYEGEDDNWGESTVQRESVRSYQPNDYEPKRNSRDYTSSDDQIQNDVWDDDVESDYRPQRVNIPQTQKTPEYEEDY